MQVLEQGYTILFNYYSNMAPILTASLAPGSVGLPRAAEDITIAHVTYKCLVKLATHVWQRLTRSEYAEYKPWVVKATSISNRFTHFRRLSSTKSSKAQDFKCSPSTSNVSLLRRL